jgi:two-component system chemotaxis response regulator CheY
MIPVIFISKSLESLSKFAEMIDQSPSLKLKIRAKQSTSVKDVFKWLDLISFGVVIFDHTVDSREMTELILECWGREKAPICLYFSNEKPSKEIKFLSAIGVVDCSGENSFAKFITFINKIPEVISSLSTEHARVMVLEDLDSPRDIICALIQSIGFPDVVGVASAAEAIKLLTLNPLKYFCVVCDINMPNQDGFSFVKEIRKMLSLSYLPVVMLTSDPSESNLLESLKSGVTGFLAKPPKKSLLKFELDKARRIVAFGKDPQIGTAQEIVLLEQMIKKKNQKK